MIFYDDTNERNSLKEPGLDIHVDYGIGSFPYRR